MSDDQGLAELLGQAPRAPDPAFRYDVFTLAAERARRRHARANAVRVTAFFTLMGLVFPAAQAAGISFTDMQPILSAGAALAVAGLAALLTIQGPGVVLAYSRAALRAR